MKKLIWGGWLLLTIIIGAYYGHTIFSADDKSGLLIGEATHGHYQIELACSSCHTEPFGGSEIIQNACESCHADELEAAHDSHPKKKFTDPRNADRIKVLDARYCVSCHTEHQQEQTRAMGVTVPDDYCFHCHQDVGEDRESHKDLPYESCASAGCHNYHDNRALYEEFLISNAGQPWLNTVATLETPNAASLTKKKDAKPLSVTDHDAKLPAGVAASNEVFEHWAATSHASAGVNCSGCHSGNSADEAQWIEKPGVNQCKTCHSQEAKGFLAGKHGMKLSEKLRPQLGAIKPSDSPMEFKSNALNNEHSCTSCHGAHEFNTQVAATDACLGCHNDAHSLAFTDSPHGELWEKENQGLIAPGAGVSCASCHMPRVTENKGGQQITRVEHNQNDNLRPNEKMIRSVCMNCHGLEFAIDSLADEELIETNFNGTPSVHIESVDWAKKRSSQ